MPATLSAFLRDDRGAAMVEFSIVATLFFTLLFAAVDWGRYAFIKAQLTRAVQVGARFSAVNGTTWNADGTPTDTEVADSVKAAFRGTFAGTITPKLLTTTQTTGSQRVQVKWDYPLTRAVSLVMKSAKTISVVAEYRVETP